MHQHHGCARHQRHHHLLLVLLLCHKHLLHGPWHCPVLYVAMLPEWHLAAAMCDAAAIAAVHSAALGLLLGAGSILKLLGLGLGLEHNAI
jgi:hypothetical protein